MTSSADRYELRLNPNPSRWPHGTDIIVSGKSWAGTEAVVLKEQDDERRKWHTKSDRNVLMFRPLVIVKIDAKGNELVVGVYGGDPIERRS